MPVRRRIVSAACCLLLAIAAFGCEWHGPDPTEASITAQTGTYGISTTTVAAGHGFGGGTIYWPTTTNQGTFGALVVTPGFLMTQSTMSWYGPRIATQGFVVLVIDTNSIYDQPAARATEMLAALDWLTSSSPVSSQIDPARTAVVGWSMGGGGALRAAISRPSLKAVVALAPWNEQTNFANLQVPALVVACQDDTIAPVNQHAGPIYQSLPSTLPAEFLEIAGESHFCVTNNNTNETERAAIARQVIATLKRYVDGDTRYDPFLCPPPAVSGVISASSSHCAS